MFIDVTRFGGGRRLRLAVAAIAYTDEAAGGCAIRLIGGDSLRVDEDPTTIERRVDAALGLSPVIASTNLEGAASDLAEKAGLVPDDYANLDDRANSSTRRRGRRS